MTTDASLSIAIQNLRHQWEENPTHPLVFQLAEEYRRIERFDLAAEVLQKQVEDYPRHFSARVALGRCHMDLGEARSAAEVIEPVVAEDPTHLIANKLLAKAYLELGDATKARDRLDLYVLLNDDDWEIDDLERRLRELDGGESVPALEVSEEGNQSGNLTIERIEQQVLDRTVSSAVPVLDERGAVQEEADLASEMEASKDSQTSARFEDPEDLEAPSIDEEVEDPFQIDSSRLKSKPLKDLLAVGGVFSFDAPGQVLRIEESNSSPFRSKAPRQSRGIHSSKQLRETVTLGELYMNQGHLSEARRIFTQVLRREPANLQASRGLAELERFRAHRLTAKELLEGGYQQEGSTQKSVVLKQYLAHLKKATEEVAK
jgi:tetratricopeptide (TPR) repeat protein